MNKLKQVQNIQMQSMFSRNEYDDLTPLDDEETLYFNEVVMKIDSLEEMVTDLLEKAEAIIK